MKTEYQKEVINFLRIERELQNHSQASVARLLGISPGQLGNIESFKHPHKYTLKQVFILSQYYNIPIENIFLLNKEQKELNISDFVKLIIKYQDDKEENKK